MGRQIARDSHTIEDYFLSELFNAALKKGKGQQDILTGAIYKGAIDHTALKAGGTEDAQMTGATKGAVTTSEKYFVQRSSLSQRPGNSLNHTRNVGPRARPVKTPILVATGRSGTTHMMTPKSIMTPNLRAPFCCTVIFTKSRVAFHFLSS